MPKSLDIWNSIPAPVKKILLGGAVGALFTAPVGYQRIVDIRIALMFGSIAGATIAWVTDWDNEEQSVQPQTQKQPQQSAPLSVPTGSPFTRATTNMITAIGAQDPSSPEFLKLLNQSAIIMNSVSRTLESDEAHTGETLNVRQIFAEEEPEPVADPWTEGGNVVPLQQKKIQR